MPNIRLQGGRSLPVNDREWIRWANEAEADYFRSGQTTYDDGKGFFIGNHAGVPKLSLGDSAGNKVTWDGSTLTIVGTITATAGTIGGWTLAESHLTSGSGANTVRLDSGGTNPAISAGSATPASAPFRVTQAGALTATSGAIGGWTLGATSLLAGSGANTVGLDSGGTNPAIYAGSATPGSAPFRVTKAGALFASAATITGALAATSLELTGATQTFTPTWNGFSVNPTQTPSYINLGTHALVYWSSGSEGTLSGPSWSVSDIPAAIRPSINANIIGIAAMDGDWTQVRIGISTAGVATFAIAEVSGSNIVYDAAGWGVAGDAAPGAGSVWFYPL